MNKLPIDFCKKLHIYHGVYGTMIRKLINWLPEPNALNIHKPDFLTSLGMMKAKKRVT